jgi:hypothetical protein
MRWTQSDVAKICRKGQTLPGEADVCRKEVLNSGGAAMATRPCFSHPILVISIGALALAWTGAAADPAQAQLIDPNNHCVYQPGSTQCQPIEAPPMPGPTSATPYQQFLNLAAASGMDIGRHPTYSEAYFNDRARVFCGLLSQGELMKIVQQVTFPPVVNFTETASDRPRLEVAILRISALNYCKAYWNQEQQIEGTIMR